MTTKAIGGSSDAFYSNPEYDRLYDQQSGEFDVEKRKALVKQMIDLSQRDLPYIVLTVDSAPAGLPHGQARQAEAASARSRTATSPATRSATARSLDADARRAPRRAGGGDDGGTSGLVYRADRARRALVIGVVVMLLRRRRAGQEAVELEQ